MILWLPKKTAQFSFNGRLQQQQQKKRQCGEPHVLQTTTCPLCDQSPNRHLIAKEFALSTKNGDNMSVLCLQLVSAAPKWPKNNKKLNITAVLRIQCAGKKMQNFIMTSGQTPSPAGTLCYAIKQHQQDLVLTLFCQQISFQIMAKSRVTLGPHFGFSFLCFSILNLLYLSFFSNKGHPMSKQRSK